ncbi:Fic family protein [Corynebacterium sp. Marseille-P3884]|nr:Fic family protein [Corynebacterium sp. Marseille-P3884]
MSLQRRRFTLETVLPALEEHGFTVGDMGLLASALERPWATFCGEELYPDEWSKTAALVHSIESNHPFLDGNKRVGVLLGSIMLRVHGRDDRRISDDDWFDLVVAVSAGELDTEGIARRLEAVYRKGGVDS